MPINIQTQLHIFHDDFSTLVFFFFSKIVSYIDSFTMNAVWLWKQQPDTIRIEFKPEFSFWIKKKMFVTFGQ